MKIWRWDQLLRGRSNEKPLFPLLLQYGHSDSVSPHLHEFLELVYIPSGSAEHCYHLPDGGKLSAMLYPGDVFIVPVGTVHSFFNGKSFFVINICVDPILIPEEMRGVAGLPGMKLLFRKNPGMLHVTRGRRDEFETCLNQIIHELHEREPGWRAAASGLFRYLLTLLGRLPEKGTPEAQEYTLPVHKAVNFIQTHLAEKFTLRDLALAAGIGKSSLCQMFRKEVGKTPWELLNSLRIKKAMFFLSTRKRPSISETAYLCGFEDCGYFSRIFRRETGISPSRYRDGFDI